MGNASQIDRSQNSVRVEQRSDLNESDLGEVYWLKWYGHVLRREEDVGTSDDEIRIHISARSCALIQRNDCLFINMLHR